MLELNLGLQQFTVGAGLIQSNLQNRNCGTTKAQTLVNNDRVNGQLSASK